MKDGILIEELQEHIEVDSYLYSDNTLHIWSKLIKSPCSNMLQMLSAH